jgi:hypothetical protein
MKKLLSFFILLVFTLSAKADNEPAIKVLMEDGASHIFLLEDNPSAKFRGEELVITSKKHEVSVELDNDAVVQILYFIYSDKEDGIQEMKNGQPSVYRISDNGLYANGLTPNSTVCVYDLKGAVIAQAAVRQDGSVTIPLNGNGVFVVKTSASSFKIKK